MSKTFKQIVKDFFSPETAEVNLGAIKLGRAKGTGKG